LKILIISENAEDQNYYTKLILGNFSKIQVLKVSSSSEAIEKLSYDGPFACVLIDVDSPQIDPKKLTEAILEFIGERPVIFLGNKANLTSRVDSANFESSELNDFMCKPIELDEFRAVLQKALNWASELDFEEQLVEVDKKEFLPMKIRNFYLYERFPHDVYMEVTSTKFIKVLKKDRPYTEGEIMRYVKKGVRYFYLKKDDQLEFLENAIKDLNAREIVGLDLLAKINFQLNATAILQEYLRLFGVTESVQSLTDKLIESIDELIINTIVGKDVLKHFPYTEKGGVAEKSLLTSYFCELMTKGLGWNSLASAKKLLLASIVFDATLPDDDMANIVHLGEEAFNRLSEDDKVTFKNHPQLAAQLAAQFSGYPDTSFILEQHHELPSGKGFPHGWSSIKLTTLSCIFIIAHNFARQLQLMNPPGNNIAKIAAVFNQSYSVGNFRDPMKALVKALK
jgi:response regulator RpfG family c-di-GMP phosphodiesterase